MESQVLKGVQMDARLNEEERHKLSKLSSRVVWKIKVVGQGPSEDNPNTKDHQYIAGVCISPKGYILTMSLAPTPGMNYVGSCLSWKKGWTTVRVVRTSSAYGLSLLQLEGVDRKKVEYTDLATSGVLRVNQHVYGVGHPIISEFSCEDTFVRGFVEYPCADITEMPACLIDRDCDREGNKDDQSMQSTYFEDLAISMSPSTRMVKHLTWISSVKKLTSTQGTMFSMHPDIPMVQIKNFHIGHCGGPVFVSSGHVVGINLFKFNDINFAVHLSAINEFLKDFDLMTRTAPEEVERTRAEDQTENFQEPQPVAAAKVP